MVTDPSPPTNNTNQESATHPLNGNSDLSISQEENARNSPVKPDSSPPSDDFVWGEGLSLDVSATQMSARLEIAVEYSECYSPPDLLRFLQENKIVYGVEEVAILELFDKKMFNQPIVVSRGKPPIQGTDGYIEWQVDLTILDGARLVERKGRVDWKEHHHVLQVHENELLARLIPPTPGETGMNVYGQEIPPSPGKVSKFPAGKGVRIGENGDELYACLEGVICRDGDKISVSPTYQVQGDINLKTGNVDCRETVIVSGSVMPGFHLRAGQDIHINGMVEGAQLEAEGNIYITGGIQGDQKAFIRAGGDVNAKFINNAKIEVGQNLVVSGSITNSFIKAGHRVLADGPKAVIVGGEIQAEKEISAAILGSEMGVKTHLELGVALQNKINMKNEHLQKIDALIANYKKLQQATASLNQMRDKGKLTAEQATLRLKIIRSGMLLQAQIKKLQEEQELVVGEIERSRNDMVGIIARQIAWPGTYISILGQSYAVKIQTTKSIFALVKNEISIFGFKEHDEKEKKGKIKEKEKKDNPDETKEQPENK